MQKLIWYLNYKLYSFQEFSKDSRFSYKFYLWCKHRYKYVSKLRYCLKYKGSVIFHVGMLQIVLQHPIQKSRTSNPNKEINKLWKKSLCLYHTRHIFYYFNPFIYLINGNVCKERKKRLPLPQKLPLHVHETNDI